MNTEVSNDISKMYKNYLVQYSERFNRTKWALSFKVFKTRIDLGKVVIFGSWEFMNNATFKKWLDDNSTANKINQDTAMYAAHL